MYKEIVVKISAVNYSYNSEPVLENINLDIHRGEFLGLIGPNGSGKTTLLKIILGLIKPDSGTISLLGRVGYVPQKAGLTSFHFPVTAWEVVSMAAPSSTHIKEALVAVNMQDHAQKLLFELSGGQQQRIFIARALVNHPELLILDEPTVGVDVQSQTKFYGLLAKLNRDFKLTIILVSHDIDVVAHEVDTIACINRTLVYCGPPSNHHFVVHSH
jgi:zinc transport system ATP-binding protein